MRWSVWDEMVLVLLKFWRMAFLLLTFFALTAFSLSADQSPIVANTNHEPAGELQNGVLALQLQIAKGEWHPEAEDGVALPVYAFGEVGHALQNPGPLIRVSQGTKVRVNLHNTLAVPIAVHGLGDPNGAGDTIVHVGPGANEHVVFTPTTPGIYFYWGSAEAETLQLRHGIDSELTGAFVVDPTGIKTIDDEIFVIEMMSERAGLGARQTLATINGKSWPYTQRFQYDVGRPVHWRWINATNEAHALHLHGFYFRVDAFNRGGRVERYDGESRPNVVTQRIAQGESFDMSWSPERPGRWLFHCHMFQHMIPFTIPNVPGLSMRTEIPKADGHSMMHGESGMGQLVLGITVPETGKTEPKAEWHADRKLQLEISERGSAPRYALWLRDGTQPAAVPSPPGLIGPPIVLVRGQPVEVEVVNKLKDPTAIHWHGLELESFYDGVPGWSGAYGQITPPIAPGTSFVARMNPPRAGTFIYHTHWHDQLQLTNGLYGPLIVLAPGERFDPTSDLVFVFSIGEFGELHEIALINGTPQSKTLHLQAGKKYRFRFINISTNNVAMQVAIRNTSGLVEWLNIAKDGADISPRAIRSTKAQQTITVGETYDMEFSSPTAQELELELLLPGQKIHITQTLLFAH